ncbi:MAG: glycosyl transferase family 1 [Bacteroidota bacterium]
MKKVLIITYYWPPSGGAGVQRWLKFVKYFRDFGWEPIVYTPLNGEFPVIDLSLEKDIPSGIKVIKHPIWEPYSFYKKFTGQKKSSKINHGFLSENKKPKFSEKISVWLRGNFFIPDARVFWVKPSIKFLTKYLTENPVDAIVSSGPPHSMHLIANNLKQKFHVKWIADFRDPWTEIDFYKDLMLSNWADKKHRKLEHEILTNADEVVVIGNTMAEGFKNIVNREYQVITNGYDESDIAINKVLDEKFSLAHIGTINKDRNPESLWIVLQEKIQNTVFASKLEIKLIGKVDYQVIQQIEQYKLTDYLNKVDYIPHEEVIKQQQSSFILLLLLNNTPNAKGILTGKFFEYLAAKRPILAIGPTDGDVAKILNETDAGRISDFNDTQSLSNNIDYYFNQFLSKTKESKTPNISQYSRRELTKEFSKILNK